MADPYWDDVVLAMPMDGANNSTSCVDLKGNTPTMFGTAVISTAQAKFGDAAAYFNGQYGGISLPYAAGYNLGAGDFTIELWCRVPASATFVENTVALVCAGRHSTAVGAGGWNFHVFDLSPTKKVRLEKCVPGGGATGYWWDLPELLRDTWYHLALCRSGANTTAYLNGVSCGSTAALNGVDLPLPNVLPLVVGAGANDSTLAYYRMSGYIDDLRITKGFARYTEPFTPPLSSYFDNSPFVIRSMLAQAWNDAPVINAAVDQLWNIKMGAELQQRWSDAALLKSMLSQPWGDAGALRAQLVQRWQDMVSLRAELHQPWAVMQSLLTTLEQPWAITAGPVQALLDQGWSIRDVEPVLAMLHQPWAIAADGSVLRYGVQVLADGVEVGIRSLTIEGGLDQDVLTATLELATEADYLRCPTGATLEITITSQEGADTFALVVITPTISQAWGDTRYTVEAMSPAVLLGTPYASGLSTELSGLASAKAATLAAPLTVDWQTADWPIPPSTWSASGETPLALLKTLAAAVGAVVQSQPDGSLQVRPKALLPAPQWATAAPDGELVEILDCISTGTTPQQRSGYNRFIISSQSTTATDGLRMESSSISDTVLEVRVYQVPWVDDFELIHTGGAWAIIEPMGIEQRDITEVVEIVAGGGSCQYPVYSEPLYAWPQTNLGTITAAEDGTITAAIAGESLLELDYTTKCRLYRVHDANTEKLQLVIP